MGSFWDDRGGVSKITPHPGLSTHWYEVSENIPFTIKASLTLLVSVFFLQKMTVILGQNSTFTQSNSVRAVLEIL